MAITLTDAGANAMLDGLGGAFDDGGGQAEIQIWTTAFGTELATFLLDTATGPWGAASQLDVNTQQIVATDSGDRDFDVLGLADGTAAVCRFVSEAGVTLAEGTVTATAGGGDIELDNLSIATGQQVTLTQVRLTLAATV